MADFFDFIKKANPNTTANGVGAPNQPVAPVAPPAVQQPPVTNGVAKPQTPVNTQSDMGAGLQPTAPMTPSSAPTPQPPQSVVNGKSDDATKPSDAASSAKPDDKKPETPDAKNGPAAKPPGAPDKKENFDLMTHLTQRSNRVFVTATAKAKELNNEFVDSEHVLHGLAADAEIYNFFIELKIQPQSIEQELTSIYKKNPAAQVKPPQMSPRVKRILDNALVAARKLGFEFIAPEHLLLALYEEGEGAGARVLAKLGLKKEDLNKKITGKKEGLSEEQKAAEKKKQALEQFTIDLTAKAAQGLLDPVVERSQVVERVIHILSRRTKNNPALVGEAGVGKTAIVEGLAEKIVSKEVPEPLLNKRILQLDLMSILAGASHRGEFEERMKDLIEEVKASKGEIILFIDEIHNIVGAGSSGEGSLDASNFLKPALARGEIQIVGATTLTEYRKYVEKDPALERRFQPVLVPEPTEEAAIKMLAAIKDKYEAFHRVKIPADVIEAAVKLSKRYVGDRFLPDKAVDLIDEAASAVRLPLISLPEEIKSVETRIAELNQEVKEAEKRGDKIKARITRSKVEELNSDLKEKKDEYNLKKGQTTTSVSPEIIRDIVSRWTGIPVSKITASENDRLAHLEDIIHKRLINQVVAVDAVAQAVRRGRAGLKSASRPIGSFVFLGPTGVGKTELAKTLADVLFGSEDLMIRFDMTEYMEKHEVAKLLGAPPGYVGYEEGGKLTEAVRRKPYSVVLFDEIEKAHPDIFNIMLQILDDGRLTDNKGHTVSFKNTVVICTSNIGTKLIQEEMIKAANIAENEPDEKQDVKKDGEVKTDEKTEEKNGSKDGAEKEDTKEKDVEVKNSPVAMSDGEPDKNKSKKKAGKKQGEVDKAEAPVTVGDKEDTKDEGEKGVEEKTDDKDVQGTEKKDEKKKEKKDSFIDIKEKVMGELLKFFKPELVNRFDEVIVFEPLKYEHIAEIVKLQFKALTKLMEDQEIGFYYTDEVIEVIVQAGYDPLFGARPLKRAIQKLIENPISNLIISGKAKPADVVRVKVDKDDLVFDIEKTVLVEVDEKRVHCSKCDNDFKTEIVKNSTLICPKCLSAGDLLKIA
jgi:ATP-dependent Clp protease ATP-binding subunit ClpC